MAGLTLSPGARNQFAAIARIRWQLFVNSLRTLRGRLEMVSRIFIGFWFTVAGFGGCIGLAFASFYFASHDKTEWLALFLWLIFLFWQLFPVMATAFTQSFDSSDLLRFPLSYPTYFAVRMVYGSLDPSTLLGCLWLLGMFIGVSAANPGLFAPVALALLAFALTNILLARMVFAWLERWLAQRRTREILGVFFFLFIIGMQFIGPVVGRFEGRHHPNLSNSMNWILPLESGLPPGLEASALAHFVHGNFLGGFAALFFLCVYGVVFLWLLSVRLRAQYHGENLSETVAPSAPRARREKLPVRLGWDVPGVSGSIAAIFEKELRYLLRSGPMLFTLVMPIVILAIFRLAPSKGGGANFVSRAPDFAFPIGSLYAMLMLTNLVYNNFGAEGSGVQFYFVSPVRFREIMRGKNLVHSSILAGEMILLWLGVCFLYRPPSLEYVLATIAGILFVMPVNLSVGNLLSLYAPKKIDFGAFGKQRASSATAFASLGVQAAVFGIAAIAFVLATFLHRMWVATLILLALAAVAFVCYGLVLSRVDGIALARRETLIAELSRT